MSTRWLTETLETLMKERAVDEQKAESSKLKSVMERHKALIPKIQETLVKTECYWKCYSYGDDLIPIFEFIDDLRNRSVKEVFSANNEHTEEHIEKQDKVLNSLGIIFVYTAAFCPNNSNPIVHCEESFEGWHGKLNIFQKSYVLGKSS